MSFKEDRSFLNNNLADLEYVLFDDIKYKKSIFENENDGNVKEFS